MTTADNKWIEAISTLNELTQTGRLSWKADSTFHQPTAPILGGLASAALYGGNEPEITLAGAPYVVEYAGKVLRLARFHIPPRGLLSSVNEYIYTLDIVREDGQELYRVPASSGLNDLYRTVTRSASGVDEVLNSLLEEGKRLRDS